VGLPDLPGVGWGTRSCSGAQRNANRYGVASKPLLPEDQDDSCDDEGSGGLTRLF